MEEKQKTMSDTEEKEIQKTLEEMKKRAEQFQSGDNYSSSSSSFDSSSNLKLVLVIMGVVLLLAVFFYYSFRVNRVAPIKSITTPDVLPK